MLPIYIGTAVIAGIFALGIRIVRPTHRGVVERFGKYKKHVQPGFNWIIPVVDRLIEVNTTEQMIDAQKQSIITKDNLNAQVDAMVYFQVQSDSKSVAASQYQVQDHKRQIVQLARTTLRNIIGNLPFAEANSDRDKINTELASALQKETLKWGINIVRTELKEIDPPGDVQESMNRIIKAENLKDAARDEATAAETKASGLARAAIKEADGQKQSRILEAEGKSKAIELENTALNKFFVDNAVLFKQLAVTENSLVNNSKIIVTDKGIAPTLVLTDEQNGNGKTKIVPIKK